MSRFIENHKNLKALEISDEARLKLEAFLQINITDALASRKSLEDLWRRCIKMYEGVPRFETRDVPIENAPNIEVTLGAISCDTIYAQAIDLIFNTTPLVTCRSRSKGKEGEDLVAKAKALQNLVNALAVLPDVGLRDAAETALLYNIQLGTGVFYVPFVDKTKKTKTAKIQSTGPKIISISPEDIIIPSGTRESLDEMPFVAVQFFYDAQKLTQLANKNSWDIAGWQVCQTPSWVKEAQQTAGKQYEGVETKGLIYDLQYVWLFYDIDGDGIDEDLLVVYNHSSGKVARVGYNPLDYRPFAAMNFQRRPHLFYGMGVLEMVKPYEEKLSDVVNYATLNILLANSRVWVGDGSVPGDLKLFPGRIVSLASRDSLQPLQMADVYSSIWQDMGMTTSFANQRVGINGAISPQSLPDRASGVATGSILQQVNRRFTPAFDSMRGAIGQALRQCLYRMQERILAGDTRTEDFIFELLGIDEGNVVLDLLANPHFDEGYDIELTAASASVNKEADRRDAMILTQVLGQYYQRTLELLTMASNPQTPPEVADVARKIAHAAGEVIDRTIRTFDQVRDPSAFIIEVEQELTQLQDKNAASQEAMGMLMQGLMGTGMQLPEGPEGLALGPQTMA